ncbi:hypothetical protein WME90_29870 [Sorangium sp. So ce375]|uniref:hypothetical protein n=1 Tax=Sorangium sp. So ce375 TaxID=3133306 RepID=UPI003F5CAFF4
MEKRDQRSIRALSSAALLVAAAVGGCNALIGLEVGQLDPSTGGAGTGGAGTGGAGTGGAGTGGGAEGGGGSDGSGSGGGGGAGTGGSAGGGGELPFCSGDREGAVRGPQARWGATVGLDVTDVAAHSDGVTAIVNEKDAISVARWARGGTRDDGYGLTAKDLLTGTIKATHLSMSQGLAYLAGWSDNGTQLPGASSGCLVSGRALAHPSFVAALDEKGQCRWTWSPDGGATSTPLGLAAAPGAVVIAASVKGPVASEGPCTFATGSTSTGASVGLAALDPAAGGCLWAMPLGPTPAITVGELVVDEARDEVLAIGRYEAAQGLVFAGALLPPSQDRDVFVARFALTERAFKGVDEFPLPGRQDVDQRGAALLPGGDVVIVGSYSGSLDFGEGCPPAPDEDAPNMENFFVMRVSGPSVVWGRGFGDAGHRQWVASVAVDHEGLIYVTGNYQGEIDLGNGGKLIAPAADADPMVGFLIVLDARGNVVSASELKGTGDAYVWAAAPGPAPGDALYLGGELGSTLDIGRDPPLTNAMGSGFVAELPGVR